MSAPKGRKKAKKRDYAAEVDILADALEEILNLYTDRQRYVILEALAFSQAEKIAKTALEAVFPAEASR